MVHYLNLTAKYLLPSVQSQRVSPDLTFQKAFQDLFGIEALQFNFLLLECLDFDQKFSFHKLDFNLFCKYLCSYEKIIEHLK